MSDGAVSFFGEQPNPFARVPEIAKRLGVEPLKDGHASTVTIHVSSEEGYDLFELVAAFLDRADAALSPIVPEQDNKAVSEEIPEAKQLWDQERANIYGMGWRDGLSEGVLLGLALAGFAVFLYYMFGAEIAAAIRQGK